MNSNEIKNAFDTHLSKSPGYDATAAHQIADGLARVIGATQPSPRRPTPNQQQCYDKCAATRDASLAAAATKPWPLSAALAAAAIAAFNACRHQCDVTP